MSWIFSRAMMERYENLPSSQALVEEFSADTCSDGGQSAPLKSSPIPQAYCAPDRMTEFSRLSRYGITFAPLPEDRGEALLTSYLAGFRARTSASQEKGPELPENVADFGQKWRGSLARFDRVSSSWKTAQLSLLGDSEQSSVIWPRSGMTAGGQCWELPTLGRRTRGIDCGFWVPTPIRNDAEKRGNFDPVRSWGLAGFAKMFPTASTKCLDGWSNSRKAAKARGMWPTPVASDTSSRKKPYAQGGTPLSLAVKWPTPTVCGNYNRKGASKTSGDGLATAVAKWPTATACMSKGSSPAALTRKDGRSRTNDRLDHAVMSTDGGSLNPTWVEWLMAWPLEWSDLKPLETGKFRSWLRQHGGC